MNEVPGRERYAQRKATAAWCASALLLTAIPVATLAVVGIAVWWSIGLSTVLVVASAISWACLDPICKCGSRDDVELEEEMESRTALRQSFQHVVTEHSDRHGNSTGRSVTSVPYHYNIIERRYLVTRRCSDCDALLGTSSEWREDS